MQMTAYNRVVRLVLALCALTFALAGCGGGGGGGGGGGTPVTVTGTVLQAETYTPPASPATVTIGGQTIQTNADGTFSLPNVSSNSTSASFSATGEVSRTITVALTTSATNALGNVFLVQTGSTYTASVNGRVVTTVNGLPQPVGNATVTIGNVTKITGTDGKFLLDNLPVGLGSAIGLYGMVTAKGFDNKLITADTLQFALVAGANDIGDLVISQPSGSVPLPPYTIKGAVTIAGVAAPANLQVTIANAATPTTPLGTTNTDATGAYSFWLAPGSYLVSVTDGAGVTGTVSVTLTRLDTPVTAPTISLSH